MEQKKVPLPREVAEALEEAKKLFPDDIELVAWSIPDENMAEMGEHWGVLFNYANGNNNGFFQLIDAIRYGYEIEEEPITVTITAEMQKKLREYYKCHDIHDRGTATSRRTTISHMCEIFGIKIPGVNA